ncbi:brachyurin-like [Pseudomyrmex gracilis]|uniref:brachyurin-like n=1 Tax=Pseudomyrmex gracilis TaxID=219809 RepID=UPI000995A5C1|nr:brachyurin-like [Pseudomyrmex gracilis]XP_020291221.1 brachyurin-like [Pseudomyrmex gracilis]
MVSSALLHFGLAFIFLYVTPCHNTYYRDLNLEIPKIEARQTPFRILFENSKTRRLFCGGTLINNNFVLTAAECFVHRHFHDVNAYTVVMNLDKDDLTVNVRKITKIYIHNLYNVQYPWRHDIALVKLGVYILPANLMTNFVPWSRTSSLPQRGVDQYLRQTPLLLKLSGYGIISETRLPGSFLLRASYTYIVTWESCESLYHQIQFQISDSHICAYDPLRYEILRTSDVGSALIYNENVTVGIALSSNGGNIFFASSIPVDIPDKSVSMSFYFEANYGLPSEWNSTYYYYDGSYFEKRSLSRQLIYSLFTNKLER